MNMIQIRSYTSHPLLEKVATEAQFQPFKEQRTVSEIPDVLHTSVLFGFMCHLPDKYPVCPVQPVCFLQSQVPS